MGPFDDENDEDDQEEAGKKADPLDVVRTYLALAIQIGAPVYNHGDYRGCYEVYATNKGGNRANMAFNAETLEKLDNAEAGEN